MSSAKQLARIGILYLEEKASKGVWQVHNIPDVWRELKNKRASTSETC